MGKRILIADDEPNIVVSLEFLMRQRGYDVKAVGNAEDALAELDKSGADLVLLDVMLPRMSGYDACQKIRENPAWHDVRVLMLSAKGRDIEVSKGMAVGADAYVTKPFSTKDLVTRVGQLLGE
mgnify:CR=1 FL=1